MPKTLTHWDVKEEGQNEKSFNRWTNWDIILAHPEERTYNGRGYFGF